MDNIKTWQERRKDITRYWLTSDEKAMKEEITELRHALYVRDVEIDRISISAQQNADAAVEAEDKLEILRDAAQQGLDALKENHQWHQEYDYVDGYPESLMKKQNTEVITSLTAALEKKP